MARLEMKDARCIKCKTELACIAIRNIRYCRVCFLGAVENKFRVALAKSLKSSHESRALLALSGGPASRLMLDLLSQSVTLARDGNKTKLVKDFLVCHIDESDWHLSESHAAEIAEMRDMAAGYGAEFLHVSLGDVFAENGQEQLQQLRQLAVKQDAKDDVLKTLRMRLLCDVAARNQCNVVMLGDSATRIAIRTLANTSKGRGYSLSLDVALRQQLHDVSVLRLMRELSVPEINAYLDYKELSAINASYESSTKPVAKSIDSLTEEFIMGLDKDYPSTVATVFRTASKIEFDGDQSSIPSCPICSAPVEENASVWRERFTVASLAERACTPNASECNSANCCQESSSVVAAESAMEMLCYGCQVMMSNDFGKVTANECMHAMPSPIRDAWEQRLSERRRKIQAHAIQDYLLSDDDEDEQMR